MSLSTINSGLQMYTHDPAITQDAQYIGPNLDSGTTLNDLDRHQRADLFPPVQAKAQHKQLSHKDLDLSFLGTMTTEEKRQYIGDHIHTFVTSKQPKKAKKITGMIIDLPLSELIPGIKSTHVLNRMINEANAIANIMTTNLPCSKKCTHHTREIALPHSLLYHHTRETAIPK